MFIDELANSYLINIKLKFLNEPELYKFVGNYLNQMILIT